MSEFAPGTYSDLALVLGVKTNQVYMWAQRRGRNGFPDPISHKPTGRSKTKTTPLFDIQQVIDWWMEYEPNKGGAPGETPTTDDPRGDQT